MNRDHERSKLQIVSLCILLAMAVLFSGLTAISRRSGGVAFEEGFLVLERQEGREVYSGKVKGESVTVVCYEENGADVVDFSVGERYHHVGRVEYPAGTVKTEFGREVPCIRIYRNDALLFSGGYDKDVGMFCDEAGNWTFMTDVKAVYGNDPWWNYEFTAGDIFFFADRTEFVARGSWAIYAVVVFVSLLFALEIAFPETLFYLDHFLSVRDPEPSDFFWAMHNISCVALPILVLIGYIFALRTVA